MGKERRRELPKANIKTSKTLVVQVKDHVSINQRVGSSFNSVLPLRNLKIAKVVVGPISKTVKTV